MSKKAYRDQLLEERGLALEAAKGELIMDVTEAICELIEKEGISRQELANRIGRSKGFVSQLLNGSRNMTLSTLAEIAFALGFIPNFTFNKAIGEKHLVDRYQFEMKPSAIIYEPKI